MTLRNYKFALFSALVLSMIIPFAAINMAQAIQSTNDPYHIGKVADGTYSETAALQRVTQLMNMRDGLLQEKQNAEFQLTKATDPADVNRINVQIENIQGQIGQIMQEFNGIQAENFKLYYIAPAVLQKYQTASDDFLNYTMTHYWNGKSTLEDKKNAFPLVSIGVNGKEKAVEITLWKGIENSAKAAQYTDIIKNLMPTDVPWVVKYSEYPTPYSCSSRTSACSPLIGGINIGVKTGTSSDNACALGFDATRTSDSKPGFVTAGHCEQGLTGNNVVQPSIAHTGSTTVGTASTSVYSNGSDCDCGWVKLNTGISISDKIFDTSTSTFTPTSVTAQSSQTLGTMVQMSGAISGIKSGSITDKDFSVTYSSDGVTIMHLVEGNFLATNGDSGSPVLNSAGTSIFGEISGGNSTNTWWSPEDRVAADLGVTIVTG